MSPLQTKACWWRLPLFQIVLVLPIREVRSAANDVAPEFNVMCSIYKLARGSDSIKDVNFNAAVESSILEIKRLNMSTSDDEFFNSNFGEDKQPPEQNVEWNRKREEWKNLKEFVESKQVSKHPEYRRPTKTADRLRANRRIQNYLREAVRLLENNGEDAPITSKDIEKILLGVIFGKGQSEASEEVGKTFQNSRADGCGSSASVKTVGISLANDMVCLCVKGNSNADFGEECFGTNQGQSGQYNSAASAKAAWDEIVKKCDVRPKIVPTPERIHAEISSFLTLIGRETTATTAAHTILGKGSAAGVDCSESGTDFCINYGAHIGESGTGIPWVRQLEEAALALHRLQRQDAAQERLTERIEDLRVHARTVYEEVLHQEEQNRQNFANTTSALTPKGEGTPAASVESIDNKPLASNSAPITSSKYVSMTGLLLAVS